MSLRGPRAILGDVAALAATAFLLALPSTFRAEDLPLRGRDAPKPSAAVLRDALPGFDTMAADRLLRALEAAGYSVRFLDAAGFSDAAVLDPAALDLLAVPDARALPASAAAPFARYLERGGKALVFGLPAWERPLVWMHERWASREDRDRTLGAVKPSHGLVDFATEDLALWARATNPGASGAAHRTEPADGLDAPAPGPKRTALHVTINALSGWDTYLAPARDRGFPEGDTLTCFRAKGSPRTRQLSCEWMERDGTRWIAVVDLGTEWRSYAIPPEDFAPWQAPPGRGGPGDRLRVGEARRLTLGLALTHTRIPGGRHEYWIEGLGTAPNPFGDAAPPPRSSEELLPGGLRIESMAPAWVTYRARGAVALETPEALRIVEPLRLPPPSGTPSFEGLLAVHPRPRGVGYAKERPWRWQPLLEARGAAGEMLGTVAVLVIPLEAFGRGGAWAAFTPPFAALQSEKGALRLVRETAAALRSGVFLVEGGAERFTLFPGESVRLGARAVNLGRETASRVLRLEARDSAGKLLFEKEETILLPAGETRAVEASLGPLEASASPIRIASTLLDGAGLARDRIEHLLHVWVPRRPARRISARDGGFWLEGKPWKAHGVNYLPSSGIAQWRGAIFERWLDPAAYDPEVVDRDLRRIRALGFNSASAFVYHRSLAGKNLLDFLRRAEALGLYVNLSLRPGTPMDFQWREMRELIEGHRLQDIDTILAYDLAWEPSHFDERHQRGYAPAWREWVSKRHGSVEAAEKAWGLPAPRREGALDIPPTALLLADGPARRLVADYRAFLDGLLAERYGEARRLVRGVDPGPPVSFRMQYAGDPTFLWDAILPYDFPGLAKAVDIWEPEAYGRIGDWERVRPGRFTADWARLSDPAKPIVWSEMGLHVWDPLAGESSAELLDTQAKYYRDFYRMMRESGADGVYFWWYAGGYRVGEDSDYGILEADGTDRPVTRVIREEGPRFLEAPKPPAPDIWFEVDRDRDARGLFGVYESVKEAYWSAIEAGKTPGLRWARHPGSLETPAAR